MVGLTSGKNKKPHRGRLRSRQPLCHIRHYISETVRYRGLVQRDHHIGNDLRAGASIPIYRGDKCAVDNFLEGVLRYPLFSLYCVDVNHNFMDSRVRSTGSRPAMQSMLNVLMATGQSIQCISRR